VSAFNALSISGTVGVVATVLITIAMFIVDTNATFTECSLGTRGVDAGIHTYIVLALFVSMAVSITGAFAIVYTDAKITVASFKT
jgi:hypothetical protein